MVAELSYQLGGRCGFRNHLEAGVASRTHALMRDSLEALHQRIDDLTDSDGDFAVVCPLSGKRPVPVRGKSFPSADAAEEAVDLVVEYRERLRDVDPHLETLPVVATERGPDPLSLSVSDDDERPPTGDSAGTDTTGRRGRARRGPDGSADARQSGESVTLSGSGGAEWLRIRDAPVVRVREDGEPVDDARIGLRLNAKL